MTEYRLHGPPGCGKTYALATSWVPRAVERFGADRVVICSLTRTAAAEIASRGTGVPKENIGTLHALCFRVLHRPTIAEAHTDEWNEREPGLALRGSSGPTAENPYPEPSSGSRGEELMGKAQVLRHRMVPRDEWPQDVRYFQTRWDEWMRDSGYQDFTGLIEEALQTVSTAPGDPAVFIVDEAQDCSTLELALIRKWNQKAEFAVLAGDGDQAIYQWRGASPKAFLGEPIPEDHNYHLTQSFRVPVEVHARASNWIKQASYRYAVEYTPTKEKGEVLHLPGISTKCPHELLDRVKESPDSMVLASCGYMLQPLVRALREAGIPFHNPYRTNHGGWNPLRGGAERLSAFLRPDPRAHASARLWTPSELVQWMDLVKMDQTGFPRGAKTTARRIKAASKVMSESAVERPITADDGLEVFGPAAWAELQNVFARGEALDWITPKILPSRAKLVDYALKVAEMHGPKALNATPTTVIGTIHSVKGAESRDCFLFPDLSMSGMREWVIPGESRDGIVRAFYVGMTRSKHSLYLCGRSSACAIPF